MKPATLPRQAADSRRLLHIDRERDSVQDRVLGDLPGLLAPGDLLVLNDAATLPASLRVQGRDIEVRLLAATADDLTYRAVSFGAGDYRTRTELRPAPESLRVGERLWFGQAFSARVLWIDPDEPRLIELQFEADQPEFWRALHEYGRPIQYSYVDRALELWDVQSRFAGPPWAFEAPSAGLPLTFRCLTELRLRGVQVTSITHAAGLSSTGSDALDRRLPFPERYRIAKSATEAIRGTRASRGRIVAVGTSVVRALESAALAGAGTIAAGDGIASLRIDARFQPRVAGAVLTGMHEPGTSHFELMTAFVDRSLLVRAIEHASRMDYLGHEFGDSCLVT